MATNEQPPSYRIYLLTVWQEHSQEETPDHGWRFHLTDPQTGDRYGFTTPEALLAAIQQTQRAPPPVDEAP
jgi:hypothetical protein